MGRQALIGLSAVTDVLFPPVGHPQAAAAASLSLLLLTPVPPVMVAGNTSQSHFVPAPLPGDSRSFAAVTHKGQALPPQSVLLIKIPLLFFSSSFLPLISPKSLSDRRFSAAKTDRVWQEAAGSR